MYVFDELIMELLVKINDRVDGYKLNDRRALQSIKPDNQAGNRVYRVLTIFYNKEVMHGGFGLYLKVSPVMGRVVAILMERKVKPTWSS